MKRGVLLLCLLCFVYCLQAQNLVVHNFVFLEDDLTANTEGSIVKDQNGKKCALIKVKTSIVGLNFDVGSLGVVKTESKTGETWVYVPEGVKRITISHRRFGIVRDYDIGQTLKQAKTYSLVLGLDGEASGEEELKKSITFQMIPSNAVITVNEQSLKNENGFVVTMLPYGTHKYHVSAPGYAPQDGEVQISDKEDNQVININLNLEKNETESKTFDFSITPDINSIRSQHPPRVVFNINGIEFTMIYVEGGALQVESKDGPTQVQVPSFYIGETEVTQELWESIMEDNPSIDIGAQRPVECISWNNCRKFYGKLYFITSVQFRLPYETEWEFAAKGGQLTQNFKYSGNNKIDKIAWYQKNANQIDTDILKSAYVKNLADAAKAVKVKPGAQPVKKKKPNELGIYDMTGNVWEWCMDKTTLPVETDEGTKNCVYCTIRGGAWDSEAEECVVTNRNYLQPNSFSDCVGMRLVFVF